MNKKWVAIVVVTILGILDSGYLTYEHYSGSIPPCSIHFQLVDCGTVLRSTYAQIWGVPVALWGLLFYITLLALLLIERTKKNRVIPQLLSSLSLVAIAGSTYFVVIQFFILKALCPFCLLSALVNMCIFVITYMQYERGRKQVIRFVSGQFYKFVVKPILFKIDPTRVHVGFSTAGEFMGAHRSISAVVKHIVHSQPKNIATDIAGIHFASPLGLAAGFDYEARLTQILPSLGFGFATIGTITNHPYGGNPAPMLGRLPQSRALMVNKGFKNLGAEVTIKKLRPLTFSMPIGVSIGRTNSKELQTQSESVKDIVEAFTKFERSQLKHTHYELNISCPNLYGTVSFYPPKNLAALLREVDKLKIKKPVFIKMPIEKSNAELLDMLDTISQFSIAGIIIGNLQKNKKDPAFVKSEVDQFKVGAFSGKPTFNRSNELIALAYRNFGKKLSIIGCGGVFSAKDAYKKIKLGASLVQLITGMIYMGPTLISDINDDLSYFLAKDGLNSIKDAVGIDVK